MCFTTIKKKGELTLIMVKGSLVCEMIFKPNSKKYVTSSPPHIQERYRVVNSQSSSHLTHHKHLTQLNTVLLLERPPAFGF